MRLPIYHTSRLIRCILLTSNVKAIQVFEGVCEETCDVKNTRLSKLSAYICPKQKLATNYNLVLKHLLLRCIVINDDIQNRGLLCHM